MIWDDFHDALFSKTLFYIEKSLNKYVLKMFKKWVYYLFTLKNISLVLCDQGLNISENGANDALWEM